VSVPEQQPKEQVERRTNRERARTLTLIGLTIVITVFALLNLKEVKVDWVIGSGHAPLIIVIVISVLIGAVLSYFADRRISKAKRR
jgi:uncharacterized integral membrane protein